MRTRRASYLTSCTGVDKCLWSWSCSINWLEFSYQRKLPKSIFQGSENTFVTITNDRCWNSNFSSRFQWNFEQLYFAQKSTKRALLHHRFLSQSYKFQIGGATRFGYQERYENICLWTTSKTPAINSLEILTLVGARSGILILTNSKFRSESILLTNKSIAHLSWKTVKVRITTTLSPAKCVKNKTCWINYVTDCQTKMA